MALSMSAMALALVDAERHRVAKCHIASDGKSRSVKTSTGEDSKDYSMCSKKQLRTLGLIEWSYPRAKRP